MDLSSEFASPADAPRSRLAEYEAGPDVVREQLEVFVQVCRDEVAAERKKREVLTYAHNATESSCPDVT